MPHYRKHRNKKMVRRAKAKAELNTKLPDLVSGGTVTLSASLPQPKFLHQKRTLTGFLLLRNYRRFASDPLYQPGTVRAKKARCNYPTLPLDQGVPSDAKVDRVRFTTSAILEPPSKPVPVLRPDTRAA
jgi:hypothetical protein